MLWLGSALTAGHAQFHHSAHSSFAKLLFYYVILQAACGIFLKLHVLEGSLTRRAVKLLHSVVGKTFPIIAFSQMLLGGIAGLGFCYGEHLGQCLAHFAVSIVTSSCCLPDDSCTVGQIELTSN